MSNGTLEVLREGVVTPYVQFNMVGGSIESDISNPRYFVSLNHIRSTDRACTFKLNIIYVPDTFSAGKPTLIDNWILSSIKDSDKVTYTYGYYDSHGGLHTHKNFYAGQILTYDSDINVASGTITYTIEGMASSVDLTSSYAQLEACNSVKPSQYLLDNINNATEGGFFDLKQLYRLDINDHDDEEIKMPSFGSMPVLDLIMGKVQAGTEKDNGLPVRKDGVVQLSQSKLNISVQKAYELGLLSDSDWQDWSNANEEIQRIQNLHYSNSNPTSMWNKRKEIQDKLVTPYICYIDDINVDESNKIGTLHYVKRIGTTTDDVYEYEMGNNVKESVVLSFNVTYNGATAIASALATDNISSSITAEGSNQGTSYATSKTNYLGRNTFPTLSGFKEESFISKNELSNIMLYPYEATMTVLGEIDPHNLMDIIYIVVKFNGTEHQVLTGSYQILEITDDISSSGFTTTFRMVRESSSALNVSNKLENYVTNEEGGSASHTDDLMTATYGDATNNTNQVRNE